MIDSGISDPMGYIPVDKHTLQPKDYDRMSGCWVTGPMSQPPRRVRLPISRRCPGRKHYGLHQWGGSARTIGWPRPLIHRIRLRESLHYRLQLRSRTSYRKISVPCRWSAQSVERHRDEPYGKADVQMGLLQPSPQGRLVGPSQSHDGRKAPGQVRSGCGRIRGAGAAFCSSGLFLCSIPENEYIRRSSKSWNFPPRQISFLAPDFSAANCYNPSQPKQSRKNTG